MNIQIFGTKKCNDTKKAERFFKERRIPYQFIDLKEKSLSKGELQSVKKAIGLENLINKNSREKVMNYMLYIFVKLVKFYDVKTVEDRIELLKYNFDKFVNNIDEDNKVLEITTLEEPFISTIKLFLHDSDILIDNQLIELKWNESYEKAFIRAFNNVKK